ncbi:replication protein P [Pantoea agglomerans]|uniref:replication protein P n=1 Tax=Enterobacter agglomerans TaxID=549 RepID=UPI00241325D7|nr:replication protein P [Pantoea agglomerans]
MGSLIKPEQTVWEKPDPQNQRDDIRFVSGQFNDIFQQLSQIFPGFRAAVKTQDDLNTMRQQWVLAMVEGGIRTRAQIDCGLTAARRANTDFLPSCGRFVSWCREHTRFAAGLPSDDDVMNEFQRYARDRHQHDTPEAFPWTHDVMYWVVLDVRHLMHQHNYTDAEVLRSIKSHMRKWERELEAGREIPKPVMQLADKRRPPAAADIIDPAGSAAFRQAGEALLARIRARHQGGN